MKREMLFLTGITCIMVACSQSDPIDPVIEKEENYPICFHLDLQKEVFPFPYARSIPPLDIPEPVAGNEEEDPLLYTCLDYIVYTDEETPRQIKHKSYTQQDEDFGIIYDTLPAGDFVIAFLAHRVSDRTLNGSTLIFNEVNDTFFKIFLSG
ncbi:MAG: hypothetical protein LUD02_03825 [Tannerellaceae bacterium]|nr:hypothetical protein [Tannerellaceae bacterium]